MHVALLLISVDWRIHSPLPLPLPPLPSPFLPLAQDGELVSFSEVVGMDKLNTHGPFKVKNCKVGRGWRGEGGAGLAGGGLGWSWQVGRSVSSGCRGTSPN